MMHVHVPHAFLLVSFLAAIDSGCSSDDGSSSSAADAGPVRDATTSDASASDAAVDDAGDEASVDASDDAHVPPFVAECDPVEQNCPAGKECALATTLECLPAGSVAIGAPCDAGATNDCVVGGQCWLSSGSGGVATCAQFCSKDTDCAASPAPSGTTPEPTNVAHCLVPVAAISQRLCTVPCNPVAAAGASGCAVGLACVLGSSSTFSELTECASVGGTPAGATCSGDYDCAAGLACVPSAVAGLPDGGRDASALDAGGESDAGSVCRAVCRPGVSGDCPGDAGDVCTIASGNTNPMFGACCPSGGC